MALALKEAQFDEVRVRRLREMIGSGLGADLIRLAATAGATEDRYHVIKSVMTALEALAQKDELMACILMAHLWPRAEEHDVANAIDLWLAHCSSSELNAYLEKLVE
ncbi:MAG: hypothetical protein JSS11_10165, partial [Verrucomicrobia bacterium]|nr:hypothetical protein [Verrucomicrobiota bacterium]